MKNVPRSSGENTAQPKKIDYWFKKVDFLVLIKKTALVLRQNLKTFLIAGVLLTITGGQSVTMSSSFFSGSISNTEEKNNSSVSTEDRNEENAIPFPLLKMLGVQEQDWKTLENKESLFQEKIGKIIQEKNFSQRTVLAVSAALLLVFVFLILVFLSNCHFHLLFLKQLDHLARGEKKKRKEAAREIKGEWKNLALMRLVFGGMKILSLVVFLIPAGFFFLRKNWNEAVSLGVAGGIITFFVFAVLSYVYRYSLFYCSQTKVSLREGIDLGYELLLENWKTSILASFVTMAVHFAAEIASLLLLFLFFLLFLLNGGIVAFLIYLFAGQSFWGMTIVGVEFSLILTPLLVSAIILSGLWQSFVLTFWFFFFKEIAGIKLTAKEKVETVAVKEKKTVEAMQSEAKN